MSNNNPLLSTKQALQVLQRRFPGFDSAPKLMRQVKIGTIRVAAKHGRKYYFALHDLMSFVPSYQGQGRNKRPPLWCGQGFTLSEAAGLLGIPRPNLVFWNQTGKIKLTRIDGVWNVSKEELERIKEGLKL